MTKKECINELIAIAIKIDAKAGRQEERLKMLGNSVDPHIAFEVLKSIDLADKKFYDD